MKMRILALGSAVALCSLVLVSLAACAQSGAGSTGSPTGHQHASTPLVPAAAAATGMTHTSAFMPGVVGEVDVAANGFDPMSILTDFDHGTVSTLPGGQVLREYWITAEVRNVEVVPGIIYEAWTYNGRVPGPTIRATEGDRIRIHFRNMTPHPHSMHFHTVHPAQMDGVYEPVAPGGEFLYEFDATPFGVHPHHCHVMPLASHISRGLYGAIVVDPRHGRPRADKELVMVTIDTRSR